MPISAKKGTSFSSTISRSDHESWTQSCCITASSSNTTKEKEDQMNKRQQEQRRKRKKRVSFAPKIKEEFFHVTSYHEKEDLFYTKSDMAAMKFECMEIIRAMSENLTPKLCFNGGNDKNDRDSTLCARGLEFRTAIGSRRRRHNKSIALNTVLLIQAQEEEQRNRDNPFTSTEEVIAKAYQFYSKPCLDAARKLAIQDEIEVYPERRQQQIEIHQHPRGAAAGCAAGNACSAIDSTFSKASDPNNHSSSNAGNNTLTHPCRKFYDESPFVGSSTTRVDNNQLNSAAA